MRLTDLLFRPRQRPEGRLAQALQMFQARPEPSLRQSLMETSFAVIDIDVTGTRLKEDRITGFALMLVEAGSIRSQGSRRIALPLPEDKVGTAEALADILEALGRRPLVSYNFRFVDAMLDKLVEPHGNLGLGKLQRLDLLSLLPAFLGGPLSDQAGLLDWMGLLGIPEICRYDALSDTYSMAHLLLMVLARAEMAGIQSLGELFKSQESRRWLRG